MLNKIKLNIESNEEDFLNIAHMKAIISVIKEQLEMKVADESQQLATISFFESKWLPSQSSLPRIIHLDQEELTMSKAKIGQLSKEIDQLLYEKIVEDEAKDSTLNESHLKKSIRKLAELFGDDVLT